MLTSAVLFFFAVSQSLCAVRKPSSPTSTWHLQMVMNSVRAASVIETTDITFSYNLNLPN
jgi:hypothetical protein